MNKQFKLNNILKLLLSVFAVLLMINSVNADNWVCYDSTGSVTASQLRAKMSYQQGSPLQIIKTGTSSVTYTQSSYFTHCSNSKTYTYCPENEYFLKTTITNAQRCNNFNGAHHMYLGASTPGCRTNDWGCKAPSLIEGVDCGLGGGPSCSQFVSSGGSGTPQYSFVCGKNNDKWQTKTASSEWECAECQELAERQNGVEPEMGDIQSFRDLSFGSQFKFSGAEVDLSFMVYILACINRVPMLNLEVNLIDKLTGLPVNTEVGIYAKHETLDYNEDNLGMLKQFVIPDQLEFKKTYTLEGTLSAYRAWSWRTRLVDAMDKVTTSLGLSVPGFPSTKDDLKQGNLYYSPDFLTSKDSLSGASIEGSAKTYLSQKGSINVLKNINKIDGNSMCTVDDLENYVDNYGANSKVLSGISDVIPLVDGAEYTDIKISSGNDEDLSFSKNNIRVSASDLSTSDSIDKWFEKFEKKSNARKLSELYNMGVLTQADLENIGRGTVSGWYDYSPDLGCSNFDYSIRDFAISGYSADDEREFAGWNKYTVQEEYQVEELVDVEKDVEVEYNTTTPYLFQNITYVDVYNTTTNTTESVEVIENVILYNITYYTVTETITVQELQNVTHTREVEKQNKMFETVYYIDLDVEAVWENNIVANLDLEYEKDIDSSYSWDFASLEDLDSEVLATCLYNWDACMLKEVKSGNQVYKEVVDCGMGPPSDLAEPSMKDGARGKKTISQDVTIYRGCYMGQDWISKYKGYSCVDGKYYRCKFGADAGDFLLGVTAAGVGDTLIRQGSKGYSCTNRGWEDISCLS